MFNDIIALCHKRILNRLRSRHAEGSYKGEKRNRRFLGSVVRSFMALPWQDRDAAQDISPSIRETRLNRYRSILRALLAHLEEFEATDVPRHEDVLRVVRSIAQAFDVVPIEALLGSLRDQNMYPTLRKWLLGCFTKISRYSEVASILCHRARRISMLRKTRVRIVSGVVNLQDAPVSGENFMDIEKSLARFRYRGETVQMRMLPEWLRDLAQSSMENYSRRVRDILKEAKVHAEIQLLAYYDDEQVTGLRPRILASNKKACALCNTFIATHGEYSVPKSHGKLYRGWRLTAAQQSSAWQDDLNMVLESSISETLAILMPLSTKPRTGFDNESSIYSFNLSASTLPDCLAATISEQHNSAAAIVDRDVESKDANYQLNKSPAAEIAATDHATTAETGDGNKRAIAEIGSAPTSEHADDQTEAPIYHDSRLTDGSATSLARQSADVRLKHGQKILFSPALGGNACFRSRRIELLIDEASSRFSLELLNTAEAEAVLRDETKHVADVGTLSSEIDVILSRCANGEVYISHGKDVIRICARSG